MKEVEPMNRRELFALLAGAVAAPSELIVPRRTIFLPPAGGWPGPETYHRYTGTLRGKTELAAFYGIASYWIVMCRPQDSYGPDNPYPVGGEPVRMRE